MPSSTGCAEGLAPCLIGEFSAIRSIAARTNSLISYGIFSVNTLRRAVRLSVCLSAVAVPAACVPITPPYYFFPFGRWVAGRSFPFSKALLHGAVGCKVQGKNTTRSMRVEIVPLTAQPPDLEADGKPRACFAFANGNDCSALAGAEPPAIRADQRRFLSPFHYCRFYFSDF